MNDSYHEYQQRLRMVETQLRERGIRDERVLSAMSEVPRHVFTPYDEVASAYEDRALPIGEGQTISQPFMVAVMTEHLELNPEDKALEIGTGSGYQAAVLARLCREVYTVERVPALYERSRDLLIREGYTNVHAYLSDGTMGLPSEAPFDAIIITAATPNIPPPCSNSWQIMDDSLLPSVRDTPRRSSSLSARGAILIGSIPRRAFLSRSSESMVFQRKATRV